MHEIFGVLEHEDVEWLLEIGKKYFILKDIADGDWARSQVEKLCRILENPEEKDL
jgi:hypothetical protein